MEGTSDKSVPEMAIEEYPYYSILSYYIPLLLYKAIYWIISQ
jgi:hypothetical protein